MVPADIAWDMDYAGGAFSPTVTGTLTPAHTFPYPGVYRVALSAADPAAGVSALSVTTVTVGYTGPSVALGTDLQVPVGHPVTLTGSYTATDGAVDPWGVAWDLDYDGVTFAPDEYGTLSPTATFDRDGGYTVALQVTDSNGVSDVELMSVTAAKAGPFVRLSGPAAAVPQGEPAHLVVDYSLPAGPPSLTVEWDFDYDGTSFTPEAGWSGKTRADATYPAPGSRTAAVRVTGGGSSYLQTHTVQVSGPRPAVTGPSKLGVTQMQPLTLSGVQVGPGVTAVEWDFDYDGLTFEADPAATGSLSPTHTYAAAGTHWASVRVTDSAGLTRNWTIPVEVANVNPTAVVDYDRPAAEGGPVTFTIRDLRDVNPDADLGFLVDWTGTGDDFQRLPDDEYYVDYYDESITFSREFADNSTAAGYPVKVRVLDHETGYADYSLSVAVENRPPLAWPHGEMVLTGNAPIMLSGSDPSPADREAGLTYYYRFDDAAYAKATSTRVYLPSYEPGRSYLLSVYAVDKDGAAGPVATERFYTQDTDTVIEVAGTLGNSVRVSWGGGPPATLGHGKHYFTGQRGDLSITLLASSTAYSIRTNANITGVDAAAGVASVDLQVYTWAESHFSVTPFGSGTIGRIKLPAGNAVSGPSRLRVGTLSDFAGVEVTGAPARGRSWTVAESFWFNALTGPITGLDRIGGLYAPDAWIDDLTTYEGVERLEVYGIRGKVRTTHDDVAPTVGLTAVLGAGGVRVGGELAAGLLTSLTTPGNLDKLSVRKLGGTVRQTAGGRIERLYLGDATPTATLVGSGGVIEKVVYGEAAQENLPKISYYDLRAALMLGADYRSSFYKTLPDNAPRDDWDVHHLVPQTDQLRKRLAKNKEGIDHVNNLRLMPGSVHKQINKFWEEWKRAEMPNYGCTPGAPGHEAKFWRTVPLAKVREKAAETEAMYEQWMIKPNASRKEVNTVLAATGRTKAAAFDKWLRSTRADRLEKLLKSTGKVSSGIALFAIFSDGTAMARAIVNDPPEAQIAWQAFDSQYESLLTRVLRGGSISQTQALHFVDAFGDYLDAIKTPGNIRQYITGFMKGKILADHGTFVGGS